MQQAVIVVRFCKNERDYQHQLDELKAIAQSRSFQVSAEIVKTLQEPTGLDRLLNLSRQGQIQHVLIRELSCLGRSTDEIRYMITELTASGVNIYIQSLGIELLRNGQPTPAAKPLLTLLNELSILELEVLSQRISICAQRSRHPLTRNSRFNRRYRLFILKNIRLWYATSELDLAYERRLSGVLFPSTPSEKLVPIYLTKL